MDFATYAFFEDQPTPFFIDKNSIALGGVGYFEYEVAYVPVEESEWVGGRSPQSTLASSSLARTAHRRIILHGRK